jgi:extradiol dioxygenase family protein
MIVNGSHLIGYLSDKFTVFDLYGYDLSVFDIDSIKQNSVVYVDDEMMCFNRMLRVFLNLIKDRDDIVWVVKIPFVYEKIISLGKRAVLEPYFHIIDDLMGMKIQNEPRVIPIYGDKTFFCLNRNFNDQRQTLLKQLKKHDLIKFGYVTANSERFKDRHLFVCDPMDNYVASTSGYERCNETDLISLNVKNFYNIAAKPGQIAVVVETGYYPLEYKRFFPTEKTIIPFITHRLPLIHGDSGILRNLEKDGIDIFRDLINHSYDLMEYHDPKKSKKMIKDNIEILKNGVNIQKLQKRLKRNYDFLTNQWFEVKLQNFITNISQNLD